MALTDKELSRLGKITEKISKVFDRRDKDFDKLALKLEKQLDKKYSEQIKKLEEEKENLFKEIDKCKRCYGRKRIFSRACAEDDGDYYTCPKCNGSKKYSY